MKLTIIINIRKNPLITPIILCSMYSPDSMVSSDIAHALEVLWDPYTSGEN